MSCVYVRVCERPVVGRRSDFGDVVVGPIVVVVVINNNK